MIDFIKSLFAMILITLIVIMFMILLIFKGIVDIMTSVEKFLCEMLKKCLGTKL